MQPSARRDHSTSLRVPPPSLVEKGGRKTKGKKRIKSESSQKKEIKREPSARHRRKTERNIEKAAVKPRKKKIKTDKESERTMRKEVALGDEMPLPHSATTPGKKKQKIGGKSSQKKKSASAPRQPAIKGRKDGRCAAK
jgi:hypothetical protein